VAKAEAEAEQNECCGDIEAMLFKLDMSEFCGPRETRVPYVLYLASGVLMERIRF